MNDVIQTKYSYYVLNISILSGFSKFSIDISASLFDIISESSSGDILTPYFIVYHIFSDSISCIYNLSNNYDK